MSNTITGSGYLDTSPTWGSAPTFNGVVRIEAFQYTGLSIRGGPQYSVVSPTSLFLPSGPSPSIRISGIAGIPVPSTPTGSFTVPDIAINTASPVPITIEARNIPVGTTVSLRLFSEQGADQILTTTPLAGTLAVSTASATATFPSGYSRGFVRATWTQ
ncbi:MAG: hypothetical protein JNL98_36585 [Bryobacterales bacterium]|nr:hypothetical protein [Bryobacterales bacterium]